MILGLTLGQFTALHVAISLVAIASGIVVLLAFAAGRRRIAGLSALFLITTAATTLTGFLFPFNGPTPAFVTGVISIPVLAVAFAAYFGCKLQGRAAAAYAVSASIALYFNLLAFVTQAFLKVPPLHALAPSGTEPPFLVAQVVMLAAMIGLGTLSFRAARRA
ncbi:hypothetical protein EDF56_1044 [Novosphingobium sp. PhB165]|uniref:hypothetical protein n=1 Tax=Novosphingobium sp. PhB165 TaxID=2485105 RepID=UPI00104C3DCF|nr:hypothetical protein [Novosphingobium sp. PhB165]TCM18476.1 hypothetical protein EDF56_1044 [Novosphingobium sp. PhB165]